MDEQERNRLISLCFEMGLLYTDILRIVASECGTVISLRHLKRLIKHLGLSRRKDYSPITEVIDFIQMQLRGSGSLHGYRWMFTKCSLNKLKCKKEDVRIILQLLDPEGTDRRRRRRLRRRVYSSKGPNYLWHVDGYDKLKRYGICVNGCIDGYSRKIIWMNAYHTSSNPKLIGGYYMEKVAELGGCPRVVRGDLGTENVYVRDFQRFLRRNDNDAMAGIRSYLGGASTSNQRIEYFWSFLRRECTDFWMCLFRTLDEDGYFIGNDLDVNLIRFCFMHLIQDDLDEVVTTWNHHLIRPTRNAHVPSGRPNILYHMPELYETHNYICLIPQAAVNLCKEECIFRETIPCEKDVYEMGWLVMHDHQYEFPSSPESAVDLYKLLRGHIYMELHAQ